MALRLSPTEACQVFGAGAGPGQCGRMAGLAVRGQWGQQGWGPGWFFLLPEWWTLQWTGAQSCLEQLVEGFPLLEVLPEEP